MVVASMVAAVLLGIIVGAAGFVPLVVGLNLTKKVTETSNFGHMAVLLLSLAVSFAVLAGSLVACRFVAYDLVLPFALSEVGALSVTAIGFGVSRLVRR